jgi:hypothetical protein
MRFYTPPHTGITILNLITVMLYKTKYPNGKIQLAAWGNHDQVMPMPLDALHFHTAAKHTWRARIPHEKHTFGNLHATPQMQYCQNNTLPKHATAQNCMHGAGFT